MSITLAQFYNGAAQLHGQRLTEPLTFHRPLGYYWIRRRVNRTEESLVLYFHGFQRVNTLEQSGYWGYSPVHRQLYTGTEFGISYIDQYVGQLPLYLEGRDDMPRPGIILELPL